MKRLLLLACGVSALAIAGEVWSGAGQGGAPAPLVLARTVSTAQPAPAAASAASVDQWVGVTLARPLFAADRRPVPGSTASASGLPRLSGVIVAPDNSTAIFEAEGAAKPVTAHGGDRVGAWVVATITANLVTLQKGSSSMALRPAFGGTAQAVKADPNKDGDSRWVTAAASGILRARWSNPQLQP